MGLSNPTLRPEPLPPPRALRRFSGQRSMETLALSLTVVTPILGGGAKTGHGDELDPIRVPSIRGQLRFWWRALHGGSLSPEALYKAEGELWGHAGDDSGGRSLVEVSLSQVNGNGNTFEPDIHSQGAYALWPAIGTRQRDALPVRKAGTTFTLHLSFPSHHGETIRKTLCAWILFGGYGSRSRRGLGSLTLLPTPTGEREMCLPTWREDHLDFTGTLLGSDFLRDTASSPGDLPLLNGSFLFAGSPSGHAETACNTAIQWLREFRQGTGSGARDPGRGNRPGQSHWPEPDKVRRLSGPGPWSHPPRFNDHPVWPRAGFGLPIVSRFQTESRTGGRLTEPADYEIIWRTSEKAFNRLASPLILKALPLADGRFAPCALWLHRAYPNGEVCLKDAFRSRRSGAAFDLLNDPGDTVLFPPLAAGLAAPAGTRLRTAFFTWLQSYYSTVRQVLP